MPIVSGGSGGGFTRPSQWTVASDGGLFIDGAGTASAPFGAQLALGATASLFEGFDSTGHPLFTVGPTGLTAIDATVDGDTLNISKSGTSILHVKTAGGVSQLGFFAAVPVAKPTGVAVTAAAIHAALVSLGLIAA